jgi:probable rRNA maturation factor
VRKAVSFLLKELKISTDEVIFHFVSEKKISSLHKKFFNDPSPTDCITFPIDPPGEKNIGFHLLGEAFICPKTAMKYADPQREIFRYIIHCILHLIGYEDVQVDERRRMKRKEHLLLKKMDDAILRPLKLCEFGLSETKPNRSRAVRTSKTIAE